MRGLGSGDFVVASFGDDVGFYHDRDLFSVEHNAALLKVAELCPEIATWPRLARQLLSAIEQRDGWVTRVLAKRSADMPVTLDELIASWERAAAWQNARSDEAKATPGYQSYDLARFVRTADRVRDLLRVQSQAA